MRTKTIKKNKINVVTLGCSKNIYDSEVLMGQLKANGKEVVHEDENDDGNIVVINTCGFIGKAKEESVETILHYAEKKEAGEVDKVFVSGCLSERYKPDLEKEIPNVDQYFGTHDLPNLLTVLEAGRLHNKVNLMNELSKIKRVMQKVVADAPHEVLLVLDGSTGQNAFEQAKQFTKATEVSALAVTKLDGTAKGGVVIGISDQFQIPVKYIGVGEGIDDLQVFNKIEFVDSFFK